MQRWSDDGRKRVLVLSTSPRKGGNSRLLASAFSEGAREAGHQSVLVDAADHVRHMMRYCADCRNEQGECTLDDDYRSLFLDLYVHADAIAFATPMWWYGTTALMKAIIDRTSCYISASSPHGRESKPRIMNKRIVLLVSAEESNFASRLGMIQQIAELCTHTRSDFVGAVFGVGNTQGEIERDPARPIDEARRLGGRVMDIRNTDYELDSVRSTKVWEGTNAPFPSYWR